MRSATPDAPIRVGYDGSVLVAAGASPAGRTGIFRVADTVARGLATSGECDLRFLFPRSLNSHLEGREYMAADSLFAPRPILTARASVMCHAGALRRGIRAINERGDVHGLLRVVRGGCDLSRKVLERASRFVSDVDAAEIDVYHSPYDPLPVIRARRGRRPPRFLTVYDLIPILTPQHFVPGTVAVMRAAYASLRAEDWVFAISECTRDDLLTHRPTLDPARVLVTPLAADPTLFRPEQDAARIAAVRRRLGIADGPYILSLNTLEPRKNLDHLVRTFATLLAEHPNLDLQLVLAGASGWKAERLTAALGVLEPARRRRVVMTGYVPDADLAPLYSGALAFCYPSLYEGFGLPPLEAMQCGLPVVTSNTSSLPEVVGDAGIMVPPTDGDALAHAMLALYRDAGLRAKMRDASLARASAFTWERCVSQTISGYRTALAS